jgi:hypothetical protein
MASKTKEQLETELSAIQVQNKQKDEELSKLRETIEDQELEISMQRIMESKTRFMQIGLVVMFSLLVLSYTIPEILGINHQIDKTMVWFIAFLAVVVLVGYLSQIAMMLNRQFSLKSRVSTTGAQIDASVGAAKSAGSARKP